MPFPRWIARVNLWITNPILIPLARRLPGMGIIWHTGRKSQRVYRTPVLVFRHGPDRFVIALTYGVKSQWVQNVLAKGECKLETEGGIVRLSRPRLFHDTKRKMMPGFVRFFLGLLDVSDFLELAEEANAPVRVG